MLEDHEVHDGDGDRGLTTPRHRMPAPFSAVMRGEDKEGQGRQGICLVLGGGASLRGNPFRFRQGSTATALDPFWLQTSEEIRPRGPPPPPGGPRAVPKGAKMAWRSVSRKCLGRLAM